MTPIWRVELFGGLRGQSANGAQFSPGVSKAGALFACLVLAPQRSQSRDYLATLLWPESDETTARARLRHELSVLRRQLEPEGVQEGAVITADRDRISLVTGSVVTDVELFLDALAQARDKNEPTEHEQHLKTAVTLYRGKLLPGYDYEGVELERSHLSHSYESTLRDLAVVRQQLGNCSGAESSLRSLIAYNPFLEEAHTDLMRLYALQSQPSRVREQYRQLEQMLRSEFDAEPSEAARLLVEGLSRKEEVSAQLPPILSPAAAGNRAAASISATRSNANSLQPFSLSANGAAGTPSTHVAVTSAPYPSRPASKWTPVMSAWVALAVLTILGVPGFLVASHARARNNALGVVASGSTPASSNSVRWGEPDWVYAYTPQRGEKPNSDPRAVTLIGKDLFVTGFEQTESEDTDMLTLKISPEGKLLARDRYSGPAHDCDRALSIVAGPQGDIYVAGESYVPARTGVPEGWHIVVIRYDTNLNRIWVRQSAQATKEAGDSGVQVLANAKGGCWVGGTALVNGTTHLMVQRYDIAGKLLWSRIIDHESIFGRLASRGDATYACGTRIRRDSLGLHNEWMAAGFGSDGRPTWERAIEGPGLGGVAVEINSEQTELFVVGTFHLPANSPGGPGVTLGAARLEEDTGQLVWTKWPSQGYLDVNCGGSTIGENGVLVMGQCTLSGTEVRIEAVRYNTWGDQLWERKISAPTGFTGVIGAANHSRGLLGLSATNAKQGEFLGGDLLVTDEQGHGYGGGAPLALRPLGNDASQPRAIQTINSSHGYIISQTTLATGPILTVTKFQR